MVIVYNINTSGENIVSSSHDIIAVQFSNNEKS